MKGGSVAGVLKRNSALTLFVTWVFANDTNHSLTTNDAAGFTERFDGWTNAHGSRTVCVDEKTTPARAGESKRVPQTPWGATRIFSLFEGFFSPPRWRWSGHPVARMHFE